MNWSLSAVGALLRHGRRRSFGLAHVEERSVDLVHRHERRGHAGGGLERTAAIDTLLAAEIIGHGKQTGFDLALLLVLRIGIELVARHDLRRNWRLMRQ